MKKKGVLLLAVLLLMLLCGCGKKASSDAADNRMGGYAVPMMTNAGTGYFWDCTIDDESVVRVETGRNVESDSVGGDPVSTEFMFYGLRFGETTAQFTCRQSWTSEIVYHQSCQLTVDDNLAITCKMGVQEVTIQTGLSNCIVSADDGSLLTWTEEEAGTYRLTPLQSGNTTVHFTKAGTGSGVYERAFSISVDSAGNLTVAESEVEPPQEESYTSLSELSDVTDVPIKLPENYTVTEMSDVGGVAYVTFLWNGIEISYICGDLDPMLLDGEGTVLTISRVPVQVVTGEEGTIATWERGGCVYCITCEYSLSSDELISLVSPILLT